MDIHKPKPWHGLREFLKEYVIIVVGVLTALAAEQMVEAFRWSEKVRHAEAQEAPEIASIYADAYERDVVQPCIDRRIEDLKAALLTGPGEWKPLASMKVTGVSGRDGVLVTPNRLWPDQVWQTLVADGTVSHLRDDRELLYGSIAAQSQALRARHALEIGEISAFNLLRNHTVLSWPERNEMVLRLEQEEVRNDGMASNARRLMINIARLGPPDTKLAERQLLKQSGTYRACFFAGFLPVGSRPPADLTPEDRRLLGVAPPAPVKP
jgi:hypothetical protein